MIDNPARAASRDPARTRISSRQVPDTTSFVARACAPSIRLLGGLLLPFPNHLPDERSLHRNPQTQRRVDRSLFKWHG